MQNLASSANKKRKELTTTGRVGRQPKIFTPSRLGGPRSSVDDIRTYWWEVAAIVNFENSLEGLQNKCKEMQSLNLLPRKKSSTLTAIGSETATTLEVRRVRITSGDDCVL